VLPGERILLSGTGPLQLALAHELLEGGAELAGILDVNPFPWRGWRHLGAIWGQWERLKEGFEAWSAIRRSGSRVQWGQTAYRAEGDEQVERVVIGPIDGPAADLRSVRADTVCLSHGFVPAVELSRQAGCEHRHHAGQGTTVPVRDAWLETTRPGLFAAGDGAGVSGKDIAMLEGSLAAMGAARHLGHPVPAARISAVRRELSRQRRFSAVLDDVFPFSPRLRGLLTDDTVICRCEEITVEEVRRIIAEGATTMADVRRLTRAGMGRCQGRMCGNAVARLLAEELGCPVEAVKRATPRAPILPVPLKGLSADGEEL
jgi:NAD(P)H-nitrite reductase large subunit